MNDVAQQAVADVAAPKPPVRAVSAIAFVTMATFIMAFQDAVVKFVSADMPLWQIFTTRSLIAITLLNALLAVSREARVVRPRALGWATLRGSLIVAMYVAFYAALPFIDLSVVAGAYYTGPLFIALFAAILIGERVNARQGGAILLGFAGVLVILQPGTDGFAFAMLIPIASAIFYALSMVLTRGRCVLETAISLSVVLNLCFVACGLAMTAVLALLDLPADLVATHPFLLGPWVAMGPWEYGVVAGLAVLNLCIHILLAKAYQTGVAPVVASFDYCYLIFAAFWGYVLLSEPVEATTVLGMMMIAAAGLLVIYRPVELRWSFRKPVRRAR